MDELRVHFEQTISQYHALTKQEKDLLFIKNGIQEKKEIGLHAEITLDGKSFPLHDLFGGTPGEVYTAMEEDVSIFVAYLIQMNQTKINDLLLHKIKPEVEQAITKEETKDIKNERSPDSSEGKGMVTLSENIASYEVDAIITPTDLFDNFPSLLQEEISLSDIHRVLRELVDQEKMRIIHHASCFKCPNGYEQDYEKLPRDVTCGSCGAEIVNIEIRYKKIK